MANYSYPSSYYGSSGSTGYYSDAGYYSYGYYKRPDNQLTGPDQTVFYSQTVGSAYSIDYTHENYYGRKYQNIISFDNQSGQYSLYSNYISPPGDGHSYERSGFYTHNANGYTYYYGSSEYNEFLNPGEHSISIHYTHSSVPDGASLSYESVSYSYNARNSAEIDHGFASTYTDASGYAYYTSGSTHTYLGPNGPGA